MKWIHHGKVVDLTDNEVGILAELAVLIDAGHTGSWANPDGEILARPVINPRLL